MGESKRRLSFRDGIANDLVVDGDLRHAVTTQDVEPVLAAVARDRETMRNNGHNKKLGTIPAVVVADLINRGIFYDPDAFDRWWNSTEANPWRIWQGSI